MRGILALIGACIFCGFVAALGYIAEKFLDIAEWFEKEGRHGKSN